MDTSVFGVRSEQRGLEVPQPLRAGVALAALAAVPLALGLGDVIRPLSGLVFAAIFVGAGSLRSALAYYELTTLRHAADNELRRRPKPQAPSALLSWRSDELTGDRHRLALAHTLSRLERDLSPARLPGASPLNRVAARPQVDLIRRIEARLEALDLPVEPRAVLELEDLLTLPESPLYSRERAGGLRVSLLETLESLSTVDGARR
jgi:hypothetical protein